MPYNTILKPKASTNGSDYILRRVNLSTRYSEAGLQRVRDQAKLFMYIFLMNGYLDFRFFKKPSIQKRL